MKKQNTNTKTMKKQNTTPAPQCLTQSMQDQLNTWDFTSPVSLWKSIHASGFTSRTIWLAKNLREGNSQEIASRFSFEMTDQERAKYDEAYDLYQGQRSDLDYEKSQELYQAAKNLEDQYEAEKVQAFRDWWIENTNRDSFWLQAEKFSTDVATVEELRHVSRKALHGLRGIAKLSSQAIERRMWGSINAVAKLEEKANYVLNLYGAAQLPTREQSEALQQAQINGRWAAGCFDGSGLHYEKETAAKDAINAATDRLDAIEALANLESRQDANSYRVDILSDMLEAHNCTSGMDYKERPLNGAAYTAWADLRKELKEQLKHLRQGQSAQLDSIAESVAVLKLVRGMAISKELNRELQEGKASDKKAPAWHEAVDAFEYFLGEFKAFEEQAAEGKKEEAKEVAKK